MLRYEEWDRAAQLAEKFNQGVFNAINDTRQPNELYHQTSLNDLVLDAVASKFNAQKLRQIVANKTTVTLSATAVKSGTHGYYPSVLTVNWRALNRLAWASSRNARAPLVRRGPK